MTRPIDSAAPLLVPALLLGAVADLLFRGAGGAGLNVFLWVMLLCGAWYHLRRRGGHRLGAIEGGLLSTALLLGLGWVWRANPMLRLLDACALLIVAALLPLAAEPAPGRAWAALTTGQLTGRLGRLARRGMTGLVPAVLDTRRTRPQQPAGVATTILAAGRGAALAVPPLVLFGALFSSADPVFRDFLRGLIEVDLSAGARHSSGVLVGAWAAAAVLGGMLPVVRAGGPLRPGRTGGLSAVELAVLLGLLDLLFAGFVLFQLPYLFGGDELVRRWAGVGYASYARRGFFELVMVTALVLPLLLVLGGRVSEADRAAVRWYRGLAGAMTGLVLVIIASAMQRMMLYEREYGLTQDRLFASAVIAGLAVTLLWFAATVLRGRTGRFAPGALIAWAAWLATLAVINPERVIVEVALDRARAGLAVDASHLAGLSTDATPALAGRLTELPPAARQIVLTGMRQAATDAGWRGWTLSGARARAALPMGR
jgi:hypothetical protein